MSSRHHQRRPGQSAAIHEDRKSRASQHRRLRRSVNQDLHVAAVGDKDIDDLALARPKAEHGYYEPVEATEHAQPAPPKRRKHWKQPFWKRRNVARAERNRIERDLVEVED